MTDFSTFNINGVDVSINASGVVYDDSSTSLDATDIQTAVEKLDTKLEILSLSDLVDDDNLAPGEYQISTRLIDYVIGYAGDYSILVITDIGDNSTIYVRCTPTTYVPGVVFFSETTPSVSAYISCAFESSDFNNTIRYGRVDIPTGTKCIVIQAHSSDSANINKYLAASFEPSTLVSEYKLNRIQEDVADVQTDISILQSDYLVHVEDSTTIVKIDTKFTITGLLRQGGAVDTSYTDYCVTDFIELPFTTNRAIRDYVWSVMFDSVINVHCAFLGIAFYDTNQEFISGILCNNAAYEDVGSLAAGVRYGIKVPFDARYYRMSAQSASANSALYYAAYGSIDNVVGEMIKSTTTIRSYETLSMFEDFVDIDNLVGTYHIAQRYASDDNGSLIMASDFSCLDVSEGEIGDNQYIWVRCIPSQYVPGVIFFSDDTYAISSVISNAFNVSTGFPEELISRRVAIPENTKHILVQSNTTSSETTIKDYLAASFTPAPFASKTNITEIQEDVMSLQEDVTTLKGNASFGYWRGKNVWWCGTSIPAAGYWNVDNTNAYPYLTGQLLGVNRVYNESVGSSCAHSSTSFTNTYEVVSRRMGDTIAVKLQVFNDCWTVDDTNQTVTAGPRTLGITSLPTISTYESACTYRMQILSNCHEIKLIAKYLLSNETEHTAFLQEKFGDLYDTLITLHPTAYTYQGDIDLFVLDHSNNDGSAAYTDISNTDITTYIGALNTYIRLIYRYKPRATVVLISNYVDSPSGVTAAQEALSEYWHIPFGNLLKLIPVGMMASKVLVKGYWDTSSIWHDEGFEWEEDADNDTFTTNLYVSGMSSRAVGSNTASLTSVKAAINPQQIDGVWHWECYLRDLWMRDGLHPHTDASQRCLKVYAQAIAGFLSKIGDGVY